MCWPDHGLNDERRKLFDCIAIVRESRADALRWFKQTFPSVALPAPLGPGQHAACRAARDRDHELVAKTILGFHRTTTAAVPPPAPASTSPAPAPVPLPRVRVSPPDRRSSAQSHDPMLQPIRVRGFSPCNLLSTEPDRHTPPTPARAWTHVRSGSTPSPASEAAPTSLRAASPSLKEPAPRSDSVAETPPRVSKRPSPWSAPVASGSLPVTASSSEAHLPDDDLRMYYQHQPDDDQLLGLLSGNYVSDGAFRLRPRLLLVGPDRSNSQIAPCKYTTEPAAKKQRTSF